MHEIIYFSVPFPVNPVADTEILDAISGAKLQSVHSCPHHLRSNNVSREGRNGQIFIDYAIPKALASTQNVPT